MIRRAALGAALLTAACAAPIATVPPATPLPQPGDTWTYRLLERPIGRAPAQSNYVVKVAASYLAVFENPMPGTAIRRIEGCFTKYVCTTQGRVVGWEAIQVPAGSFDALKVAVEQEWSLRPHPRSPHEAGVLRLTIWYSPQAKRAVKVSCRLTGQGGRPPFDADFDLELVSYQIK